MEIKYYIRDDGVLQGVRVLHNDRAVKALVNLVTIILHDNEVLKDNQVLQDDRVLHHNQVLHDDRVLHDNRVLHDVVCLKQNIS